MEPSQHREIPTPVADSRPLPVNDRGDSPSPGDKDVPAVQISMDDVSCPQRLPRRVGHLPRFLNNRPDVWVIGLRKSLLARTAVGPDPSDQLRRQNQNIAAR